MANQPKFSVGDAVVVKTECLRGIRGVVRSVHANSIGVDLETMWFPIDEIEHLRLGVKMSEVSDDERR
jgi:uncharacterized protein YkvS